MIKPISEIQGGKLLLKTTSLGEVGLLSANDKTITGAVWFNTKLEALNALGKIIEELTVETNNE